MDRLLALLETERLGAGAPDEDKLWFAAESLAGRFEEDAEKMDGSRPCLRRNHRLLSPACRIPGVEDRMLGPGQWSSGPHHLSCRLTLHEYDGIEYSGLPIKPIYVRYHQTHQGISDTPELPTIHLVPDAPMMRWQVLSTRRRCHSDG